MTAPFISTNALTSTLRLSVMKSQVALAKATQEATTGRNADVGQDLGALAGRDIVLRASVARMDKIVDTNKLLSGRMDTSQAALTGLIDTAKGFIQDLLAARDAEGGANVILPSAKTNLTSLIATLNTTMDGQYLFGGINTGVEPVTPYAAGSTSKTAVDAAFLADFGVNQTNATVATITPAAMQTFLDTTFANLFADPSWGNDWSVASDQTITSRISTTETVQTSTSANELGMRKLAMAYTMMSDLGAQGMNTATYKVVVDQAIKLVGEAIYDQALEQGKLGTSQERIVKASESMLIQKDLLTQQVNALEAVDPAEASVRVTALKSQVEMALALTAQIQKLTILDYM